MATLLEIRNGEAMVPDFAGEEYVAPMKAAGSAREYASKKRPPLTVIEWRAGRRAKGRREYNVCHEAHIADSDPRRRMARWSSERRAGAESRHRFLAWLGRAA